MKSKIPFVAAIVTFFLSCNQQQKQTHPNVFALKVVEAKGYVIPKDSMAIPKPITAGKPKVIIAGKPTVMPANTNMHLAGIPKTVLAGTSKICTPGKDSFSLPKVVQAIDRPFVAGMPEVVLAKDARSKDQNSQNFSSFTKLEGLKDDAILCMFQDKNGNIWIGSWGGGVSKYDGKNFTHFTVKQGLSNIRVWSILEDRFGNLWFGTQGGGVSKYDGKYFTHFTEKEGLSTNDVRSMLEDKTGDLWFGTQDGGVSRFDGKYFTHFTEKEGLSNNDVRSIFQDKAGNLWFGTTEGLTKYDGKSFTRFTVKEGLSGKKVAGITEDKSGNLWIGTEGGVSKYAGNTFTNFTVREGLSNNFVLSVLEDRSGNLWFGTNGGASKYDGKSFTHFTEAEGLINNIVNCILEDRSGDLWFGTDGGGVSKYNGETFVHFTRKEGLSDNDSWGIFEDRSGNLWISTNTGGVSEYDGKSFTHFTEKEGLSANNVSDIIEDKSGNLWIGTVRGVSKYDGKTFANFTVKEGLSNRNVRSLLEDKSGNLWFATGNGVSKYDGKTFTRYTVKEGLSDNHVGSILEDKSGNLWFGTDEGLTKYDGKTFTHFTEKEGLSGNNVSDIIEDKSGNLWIGTDKGASKYDGKTFTHFTEKEGLSNNNVQSLLEDKSGNLWFGTDFGLNKLTSRSLKQLSANAKIPAEKDNFAEQPNDDSARAVLFKSYSYEDGFLGVGCNPHAIFQDKNGTIWIGANDRITAYHPEGDKTDSIPPNIQLTKIALFNENIPWTNLERKKDTSIFLANEVSVGPFKFDSLSRWYNIPEHLSLTYNNNYLSFSFIGITTKSPQKVKYKYKLEGLDNSWSALTTRTEAAYGNLPNGKYTFKVKAMNSEGYWSKELNYSFTINPPWWNTWLFKITAVIFVAALLYGLMRWRIYQKFRLRLERSEKEKQLADLRHKTVELEMQALRAQMNPHFIFNCLSSINGFILKNETESASDYLTKFSKLIRMVLTNSKKTSITLEDELEMLRLYLEMERLRFQYSFDYSINFKNEIDPEIIFIPPLLLQPFAENAIWHGLMHKQGKGHLEVLLSLEEKVLTCIISDNGIGRYKAALIKSKSAEKQKSMGLQITKERLALLNQDIDAQNSFNIEDITDDKGNPAGTKVILKMHYMDLTETIA